MRLFDTHAHLDSEQLADDLPGVLERARCAGVVGICVVGCTVDSSQRCCSLAAEYPDLLRAAVGIQPNYVATAEPDAIDHIAAMAERDEVVAIGETGIDCYWKDAPLELQIDFFQRHLDLAAATRKPFIVHMRESGREIRDVLAERSTAGPLAGVMHSFTGDWELAESFLAMGLHLSFAGMVTFKKSAELRHVAARVPAERLLIETDAPYLSPEPLRAKRPNEPARVVHTARCIAEARGMTLEALAELTTENAVRLFRI